MMIYLKMITIKLDKYIKDKNEKKYKKLEASVFKNIASSSIPKRLKSY